MKNIKVILALVCIALVLGGSADARKKNVVKAVGGTIIPQFGIAIDASYDPKLNNFVPGYKMLNVAILNNSFNIIELNPEKDQWWIKAKAGDKKYRVIGNLRGEDSTTWNKIPEKSRSLISYPLLIPIGARQVIDIFAPKNVPLEDFRELIIYIDSIGTTFEVLARQ